MYILQKGFLYTLVIFGAIFSTKGQRLDFLPPVINRGVNKDTATSILLSTGDGAKFQGKPEKIPFTSSVQIIDADHSWPPRWYSTTPVYTNEMHRKDTSMGRYHLYMIMDARIVGNYLSFYKILSNPGLKDGPLVNCDLAAYILLNEKMEAVDTVRSTDYIRNLYFHDLAINSKGERLVNLRKDTYLDLRDFSNDYGDTAVHCNVDYLQILDPVNDSIIFNWNPLEHIHPDLFEIKQTLKERAWATKNTDLIEWTRLTSAQWDYDENIIFDMKKVGLGKINRKYGYVMWQITQNQIPLVAGQDTIRWYNPHDFNLVSETDSTATYSVYSNGTEESERNTEEYACGVIFEMNKKTQKIKLIRVIWPQKKYIGSGQGNISCSKNGGYVVAYGNFDEDDESKNDGFVPNLEYGRNDTVLGIYEFPRYNRSYKAHRLENFQRPTRPTISIRGDELEAYGDCSDWVWYQLSGPHYTNVKAIGSGPKIKYKKNAMYCVEGKLGIGYSVSRMFSTKANEPY